MDLAFPIGFALLLWWLGTGTVLWLVRRPAAKFNGIGKAATLVAFLALLGVVLIRSETGVAAAYGGFALGILSWGWHEVMFLLGFVSGPRRTPCPPQASWRDRFRASVEAILHHELGLVLHGLALFVASIGADNMVAAQTFGVLWLMRLSSKLLVFFGAPNVPTHFLPSHLAYLGSYFRRVSNPAAAIVALTATSALAFFLIRLAMGSPQGGFGHAGSILLATLAVLAVFEHLALVIRLPDEPLWSWALRPAPQTTNTETTGRRRNP